MGRTRGAPEKPSEKKRLSCIANAAKARGAPSDRIPAPQKEQLNAAKALIRTALCGRGAKWIADVLNGVMPVEHEIYLGALKFAADRCGMPVQADIEISGSDIAPVLVIHRNLPKPGAQVEAESWATLEREHREAG